MARPRHRGTKIVGERPSTSQIRKGPASRAGASMSDEYQKRLLESVWWGARPCEQAPHVWYTEARGEEGAQETELAKEICVTRCPYVRDCYLLAACSNERYGVWGGWTIEEIRAGVTRDGSPVKPYGPSPGSRRLAV